MAAQTMHHLRGLGHIAPSSLVCNGCRKAMAGLNKAAGEAARLVLACNGDESSMVLETTAETEAAAGRSGRGSPEPPPLVFICAQCKRVLGDSSGWMESDMGDQSVMLKGR